MKISIVTDEISADPETAIELGVEWGIRDFELRGFYTDRVPNLSAYQKERLGEILAAYESQDHRHFAGIVQNPVSAWSA